jgi:hypothetical protein
MTIYLVGTTLALCLTSTMAFAQDWTLNSEDSRLAFGSIKNSYIREAHTFEGLTGTVSREGVILSSFGYCCILRIGV